MNRNWIVKEPGNPATVRQISSELGIDPVLGSLLAQRGIQTFEEARSFFRPSLDNLHDPFLMNDMDKAVERLATAVENREKIMIYGDYDVDGTTAVALLFTFLRDFTDDKSLCYYIPDRYDEGYGISYKGIDDAKEQGCKLVIALDCGIKAVDKVIYAKNNGIDMIICDHHLPDAELPPAFAVLDPKRTDNTYPFDDLSGCGVGFKLVQGYAAAHGIPFGKIQPLLDLLAVSIACDLVSVTGENRILAYYGLKQLNENPRKGLESMIKVSGLENHVTESVAKTAAGDKAREKRNDITIDEIVFKIGPRINAAGRMESGRTAVDLLVSKDDDDAKKIGFAINTHNNERKSIDRRITSEAVEMVRAEKDFESRKATVVYKPDWNKGVVGIVASRLVETYYRPTVVLTKSGNLITGSARSIPGFDLYEGIESCSDLLENFGGHTYAAGLTMKPENYKLFCTRFEEYVEKKVDKEMLTPFVNIDAYLDFKQINPKFFRILKQFQPFGPGNLSPVFITENVYDNGNGRTVGNEGGHLKLELIQEDEPYRFISAIAFNQSEHFEHIHAGEPIDICYSIAENFYRGIANVQLRVKDIREREDII